MQEVEEGEPMKFVPLFDNVLLKRDEKQEKKTPGGVEGLRRELRGGRDQDRRG